MEKEVLSAVRILMLIYQDDSDRQNMTQIKTDKARKQ